MTLPPHIGRTAVIVTALLAAGFFAAYLRFAPYLAAGARYTDGRAERALDDVGGLRFAVWDAPELLQGAVNTEGSEGRAALSPDGRLLVFTVGEPGLNADLWQAELVDGAPMHPRPITRLNSAADELAPAFGGDTLWFASNRSGGRGGLDLYTARYDDGGFGPVVRLEPGLNTAADETDPAPFPGTDLLTFASDRARGRRTDFDVYTAHPVEEDPRDVDGAWRVEPFEVLNTPFDEREPAYTADGRGLLYASDRLDGMGSFDLWRSVQNAGTWQPPQNLPGLNTAGVERAPLPSGDGFTLLFVGAPDEAGTSDLYRARSVELFRLPGRPVGWLDLTILGLLLLLALLAWLGRRWETLDILYKCLLVSLLAHLAMMLWFREVVVEPESIPVQDGAPSFKVRIAPSRETLSRSRERGGELEVGRQTTAQRSAPDRQAMEAEPADPSLSDAADRAAAENAAELQTPRVAGAEAPQRAPGSVPTPVRVEGAQVAVAQPETSTERRAGDAPALDVPDAAPRAAPAEPAALAAAPRPGREAVPAPSTPTPSEAAAPARLELGVPAVSSAVPTPGRRQVASLPVRRPAPDGGVAVAVEGPAALPQASRSADALAAAAPPTLDLAGLDGRASASRDAGGDAPARPSRAAPPAALSAPFASGASDAAVTPAAPGTLSADDLLGSASSRATPEIRRSSGAVAPPTRRPLADVAVDAGPSVARGADTGGGGLGALGAPVPGRALLDRTATTRGMIDGLATTARPERSLDAARAATRPARPGRFAARDVPAPSLAGTPVAPPSFRPLVVASPAPDAPLPSRAAEVLDDTPYRTRFGDAKLEALEEFGGSTETEAAVAAGLEYLAQLQSERGQWGSVDDYDDKYGHVAVGKTALCMLAFLGAGHTPDSRTGYAHVTERSVDFLLSVQDEDTGHFGYSSSYSHAISTYALAECFALTGDERLRAPLERAVAWILAHQARTPDARVFGGWGYYYPDGREYDRWPRTSITAWQVMALESARLGGLDVPDRAFRDAATFLRACHRRDRGVLLYNHDPSRLRSSYWTLPGSTPAGLFALSLMGEDITGPTYDTVLEWIMERAPAGYRDRGTDSFVHDATGNLYFWYYGSLALFRHGGEPWDRWNRELQETLLPSQQPDGSWEPISTYADYAGDDRGDRAYTTAMCVLTLEVYYRYFTPLLAVERK